MSAVPTTADASTWAPSKRTSAKRRVMSSESSSVTVTPGAFAAISTWSGPSGAAPVTSSHDDSSTSCTAVFAPDSSTLPSPPTRASTPASSRPPVLATAHDADASPATSAGSTCSRSSAEPARASVWATTLVPTNDPGCSQPPRVYAINAASSTPLSDTRPPPSSSGTSIEYQPRSAACRRYEAAKAPSRHTPSRTARSGHVSSMNRVETSSSARCSSVASVSTRPPAIVPAVHPRERSPATSAREAGVR